MLSSTLVMNSAKKGKSGIDLHCGLAGKLEVICPGL